MSAVNFDNKEINKSLTEKVSDHSGIRSLKDLIEKVSGKDIKPIDYHHETGIAEPLFFPFLAIVGQFEMKLALILSIINPNIGGVLLIGPRGTAKTTSVRGLIDILPYVEISNCTYGCLPEEIEKFGIDAVCPDCAQKYGQNSPIAKESKVNIVELPLNAHLDNVIGSLDEKYLTHQRMRLKRGVLSLADKNILYIDEVNLLSNEIINSILDASAMGKYTVRRGSVFATFQSRFTLIGSMNPEEGNLRPQIMDRFGLRVVTSGLIDNTERLEAYNRASQYLKNPIDFINNYWEENILARKEIETARKFVWQVTIDNQIAKLGIELIKDLKIHSLRAEITLFEAAKALAASDSRDTVSITDLQTVVPMALRLRRSPYITNFIENHEHEDHEIAASFEKFLN
jgi:magnesium chelatase subunit I